MFSSPKLSSRRIKIPTSCITGPGALLKDNKKCLTERDASRVPVQNFYSWPSARPKYLQTEPFEYESSNDLSNFTQKVGIKSLDEILKAHTLKDITSPGRLKDKSDDTCRVIEKAKKVFLAYNVTLMINISQKNLKESYILFKTLISEVCQLPSGFFSMLNLRQLTVCDSLTYQSISVNSKTTLKVNLADTKAKILEGFYKLIFDHLVSVKPEILKEWETFKEKVSRSEKIGGLWNLEPVFIALMRNSNYALMRSKIQKLQELVIKYFPDEMTEEWFEKRNEFKKSVCFELDSEDSL